MSTGEEGQPINDFPTEGYFNVDMNSELYKALTGELQLTREEFMKRARDHSDYMANLVKRYKTLHKEKKGKDGKTWVRYDTNTVTRSDEPLEWVPAFMHENEEDEELKAGVAPGVAYGQLTTTDASVPWTNNQLKAAIMAAKPDGLTWDYLTGDEKDKVRVLPKFSGSNGRKVYYASILQKIYSEPKKGLTFKQLKERYPPAEPISYPPTLLDGAPLVYQLVKSQSSARALELMRESDVRLALNLSLGDYHVPWSAQELKDAIIRDGYSHVDRSIIGKEGPFEGMTSHYLYPSQYYVEIYNACIIGSVKSQQVYDYASDQHKGNVERLRDIPGAKWKFTLEEVDANFSEIVASLFKDVVNVKYEEVLAALRLQGRLL